MALDTCLKSNICFDQSKGKHGFKRFPEVQPWQRLLTEASAMLTVCHFTSSLPWDERSHVRAQFKLCRQAAPRTLLWLLTGRMQVIPSGTTLKICFLKSSYLKASATSEQHSQKLINQHIICFLSWKCMAGCILTQVRIVQKRKAEAKTKCRPLSCSSEELSKEKIEFKVLFLMVAAGGKSQWEVNISLAEQKRFSPYALHCCPGQRPEKWTKEWDLFENRIFSRGISHPIV